MVNCEEKAFLLEEASGRRWYFYLTPEKQIHYSYQENHEWVKPSPIDRQKVKMFCATIDTNGRIYLIAYTLSKQLIYYEWEGSQWVSSIMHRIHSRFQDISFLSVISTYKTVHILYYIESSLRMSSEILIHYYLNGDKWNGDKLWTFSSNDSVRPQGLFADQRDDLHFLYSRPTQKGEALFYSRFDSSALSWSTPVFLYQSAYPFHSCCLHSDQNRKLHLLWKESADNMSRIKYLEIGTKNTVPFEPSSELVLYESQEDLYFPTLIFLKNIYCFWNVGGLVYYRQSSNGIDWDEPTVLPSTQNQKMSFYYFTSFNYKDLTPTLGLWGMDYPNINLFMMDMPLEKKQGGSKVLIADSPFSSPVASESTMQSNLIEEIVQELSAFKEEQRQLKKQLTAIAKQTEELFSAFRLFEQHVNLKDKSLFHLESRVKQLNFEMERLRNSRRIQARASNHPAEEAGNENRTEKEAIDQDVQKEETDRPAAKENIQEQESEQPADKGIPNLLEGTIIEKKKNPNEIKLGNVSILINSDEEED